MPWRASETVAKPGAPPWNTCRCVVRYVEHPVGAWDIRRSVGHCRAHQGRFHSPRRFSKARVRRKGPGAHRESTFESTAATDTF